MNYGDGTYGIISAPSSRLHNDPGTTSLVCPSLLSLAGRLQAELRNIHIRKAFINLQSAEVFVKMCGICGIASLSPNDGLSSTVSVMNQALRHRGPDDSGQYSSDRCSIAMRRLAIIDLQGGHQPIANEDDTLHIVFNGEIYNYRELRDALESTGRHKFKTNSDTEVILHLYEEHKEATPGLLQGMFAFCIYNRSDHSLFLARDRFGEKPLFYSAANTAFAFSSELSSLLEWNAVRRSINLDALFFYLRLGIAPSPLTLFAHVQQLTPGCWLRWHDGSLQVRSYYEPVYEVDSSLQDEAAAKAAVRACILRAVKKQMISDVPLGAFLSGGIDSSTVVAAMQQQSSQPVKTFTVRFEHAAYDESAIAREVAQHLGTEHHEFVITNAGFQSEDLWRIIRHVGQPFYDSSAIPTYFISKHVRDHVTVCLSGDGGDEMFAGYDYFRWSLSVDHLAGRCPRPLLKLASGAARGLALMPGLANLDALRKARRATHMASLTADERIWSLGALFELNEMQDLMVAPVAKRWSRARYEPLLHMIELATPAPRLRQLMNYRLRFRLPEDMLVKVDRMSMATSLEVRAPMLDPELAALAMRLPAELLIKNGTTKYILREAVREWLPDSVFSHPKMGFSIPLHMFQNEQYRQLCQGLILGGKGLMNQLFDGNKLRQVVEQGLTRKSNTAGSSVYRASHQVWALLQLAAWIHHFKVTAE